jgi:hypothetical protein
MFVEAVQKCLPGCVNLAKRALAIMSFANELGLSG